MNREQFLTQVRSLRSEGKSIRAIASELGVNRGRVDRALRALQRSQEQARPVDRSEDTGSDVFVGRHSEMSALKNSLDLAISGRGQIAMLLGDPGIGKTRTAQELAGYARHRAALVLWGRCYESMRTPAYWPWIQVIRAYIRDCGADRLESVMGSGAADIAEIVPEIREALPNLKPPTPLSDPQQSRLRLFDSITSFLNRAAHAQPIVLILDNLHRADRPSLQLLEFLAPELAETPLLLIGTYRDVELSQEHPLFQTLGELTKQPYFRRLQLAGLALEEVHNLIDLVSGVVPPETLVEAVLRQTEGNPLFVTETIRLLMQDGKLSDAQRQENTSSRIQDSAHSWTIDIPAGVREAIGRRLAQLSGECNRVLIVASVIGRGFGLNQLERLLPEHSQDLLIGLLEEALEAGIVEEETNAVGRYQFSHVLIQNTLSDQMSAVRRVRLHGEIGRALEELYGSDAEAHAAELAYHFSEAEPLIGPEKPIRFSLLAGERALTVFAYDEASTHFRRALAFKQSQAPRAAPDHEMDVDTAAIASGLGTALVALAQHEEAAVHLKRAFTYYEEVGDVERATAIVDFPYTQTMLQFMKDTILQALDLVPSGSLQSARLLCSYGMSIGVRGDGYEQGNQMLEDSLIIARREQDVALESRITVASAHVDAAHLHWERSLGKCLRVLELVSQVDEPIDEIRAHLWASVCSYAIGASRDAEEHAGELYAASESLRDVYWMELALWHRRTLASLHGRWSELQAAGDRLTDAWAMTASSSKTALALAHFQVGEFDQGQVYMDALRGEPQSVPALGKRSDLVAWSSVASVFSYVTGEKSLLPEVEATAREVIANSETLRPTGVWSARCALALVKYLQGDSAGAAEQYHFMKSYPQTQYGFESASTDHLLALLAQTMGDPDKAKAHFEDALNFCRDAGYLPELGWSCYDYAAMLRGSDTNTASSEDRQRATTLLDEALVISTELGMRPLMEKVVKLQRTIEAGASTATSYPDGLSQREVEVLRLIADGRSNSEIAATLVISVRTVERHVTNIYTKIDARGRANAAAYALNHDLILSI